MRPYRGFVWGWALTALVAGSSEGRAAWDNVFQTCCWGCNQPATANYYAPPPVVAAAPLRSRVRRATCNALTTSR